jgi:hypothetical protein
MLPDEIFTGDFASWTVHVDKIYMKNQQMQQLFSLSTAPQLSISQKALGTLRDDGNIMPKHVGATIYN